MADTHHLIKTILIPQIAELLIKHKGLSEDVALKTIYGQSAVYLYGLITEAEN